jgi:hypothetical protein
MDILSYVKSLLPSYERNELLRTLQNLQEEHTEFLMPLVPDLRESFAGHKFNSPLYDQYRMALSRYVNFQGSTALEQLLVSLEQLQANFPFLEKELKRLFSLQFTTVNLTYDRANFMRYIEAIGFYIRYARKFILVMVAEEARSVGKATPSAWCRAEREWIADNMAGFASLWSAIYMREAELRSAMARVSNAEISEDTYDIAVKSLGASKLDPMRIAGFSPTDNWIFSFGKTLVEWENKRHQAAKEELYATQLRLQEMREMVQGGNASPRIQVLIKTAEERVEKLDAQINAVEAENSYDAA